MTVESYRAPARLNDTNWNVGALWAFANFISAGSLWNIIDSWTGVTYVASPSENTIAGRYKGDPIADAQWTAYTDLGNGAGIVVEMANPRSGYPPMQVVIQAGTNTTFGCVSGHDYAWDGQSGFFSTAWRVGTQGDWDLDDTRPDFAAPTKASDVRAHSFHNFGGGSSMRIYFSADEDWATWIQSDDTARYFNNLLWFGQYNAKTSGQDTVANPAYAIVSDNNRGRLEPNGGESFDDFLGEVVQAEELIGCLDENGVWQDWAYHVNPGLSDFMSLASQPNEFDSTLGIDLMEIVVRGRGTVGPGPDDRLIGSLRGIYAGSRVGTGALVDSKQYACLGWGYGVVVEWDGSTGM